MARPATAAVRLLTGEREPVRLATTVNIVLRGLQTIDGMPCEVGDRVLVKDQADQRQNGVYTVSEGEWFRAADARTVRTLQKGTTVHTQVGSVNAGRVFEFSADEPVVGSDAIAIAPFVPPDIADVVEDVESLRDETQVLKDATEASAGQAAASAASSVANAGQTAADVVTTTANLASVQAARDASLYGKGIFPTATAAIGFGVVGSGAITAGAGGTNGTFDLAFTGGAGSGAAGRFVVAGGALTQILITAPGSYTAAPNFSFTASAGLAGASAAAVLARNVEVGEYFWTEVSSGLMGMYTVAAGPVAVDTGVRASAAEVIALIGSRTVGPVLITGSVGGTAISNDSVYYWPSSLSAVDEYLSGLELGFGAVAGTIHIVIAHVDGDGTLSLVSEQTIPVVAGPSSVNPGLSILKPAGSVIGLKRTGVGTWYYTAGAIPNGESEWFTAVAPTSHTAKTISTNNGPQWKATFTGEIGTKARAAYATANELIDIVGTELEAGWPSLVSTGTDTPANYSIVMQTPVPTDGFITQVDVGADGAGVALVYVVEVLAGPTVNVISTTPVTLSNGVVRIPLSIPIEAGQFPAISGGGYKFQNSVNPQGIPAWIKAGALSNGATVANSAQHRYEIRFTIKTGLVADAARALSGGAPNTGMNLLADADPNGVVDATAIFASAAAAHPNPYVPPGSFALTAMPKSGDGFWGPGKPFVGGRRFFVPARPSLFNLYDGFRAKMAEHIANNDVLCLIADSIGHWALASNGPEHWFNLVTAFANIGIAADEPGMTALRPSSTYTPAFYGVTTSGTVSTGSRGPLGESIILADGAALAFTGAYEQVDVHYTQGAGQGSLAFAFNGGAAYKTVNAAGALALDQYSGPSLTGQAASGNFTLTAGGGPVEITGLIRLGVKIAGSRPRLRSLRASHGSYTFASFNTARLTSAIVQAGYAGGKIVPILALGINDSFGTAPATISTNISAVLNTLEAAAAPRIFAMLPTRPSPAWDGSYTGGRTYDAALGAIRQTYRSRNVLTIPIDGFDYINAGAYQEGLHFNDVGHDSNALRFIEYVAERG
ncbi:SGNH/GDSL hydrolase family protein [Mesorhizobium sp.]|uniref:SGNH/GDSL hydrolase family protein n=1 Tax=Mesorhizobium sp. TaxID=1871066 RepID=UPI000FEA552C|nr:SGNH/GDSL hydrolase family protein [Mesorhizobium sp.]RWM42785.1 MAG: SGNH/GDSL hydrolase family protein [Mesorhizobium sp.]RWM60408.1 MAG: SGNH/GDSL hydrolase family protein [Mesorhizobium sp.]TIO64476.1 MAG: SGNH/GDSL hydrolase family protein [Mesorhizobium sp.]